MNTQNKEIHDRGEWLTRRRMGLGASDAAAAIGVSRWKSNVTLWEEKCGLREPDDISDQAAVDRGIREEPGVRALFATMYPEYLVHYKPFDLVRHPTDTWRLATLDGRLYNPGDQMRGYQGPYGVLEIKTTEFRTRAPSALCAAKQAERSVDALLDKADEDDNAGKPRQGELL